MKRLLAIGLSTLLITAVLAPPVRAEREVYPTPSRPMSSQSVLQPEDLVSYAYRGDLATQGIPGYGALSTSYHSGQVTATELIQAGIRAGLLPEMVENDSSYWNAVDTDLGFRLRTFGN